MFKYIIYQTIFGGKRKRGSEEHLYLEALYILFVFQLAVSNLVCEYFTMNLDLGIYSTHGIIWIFISSNLYYEELYTLTPHILKKRFFFFLTGETPGVLEAKNSEIIMIGKSLLKCSAYERVLLIKEFSISRDAKLKRWCSTSER